MSLKFFTLIIVGIGLGSLSLQIGVTLAAHARGANRTAKFYFPLFEVIQFRNGPCTTLGGLRGTCYTGSECAQLGGVPAGLCAKGFGVCCFWGVTCGMTAEQNRTHILSPGYPTGLGRFPGLQTALSFMGFGIGPGPRPPQNRDELNCGVEVKRIDGVCSVRLKMVRLELAPPAQDTSQCTADWLEASDHVGSSVPVLQRICGNLTGQELHLDLTGENLMLNIKVNGYLAPHVNRTWLVEVEQIECQSAERAPVGCLQYFMATSGQITTLGYQDPAYEWDETQNVTRLVREGSLQARLAYSICIQPAPGHCSLQLDPEHFSIGPDGLPGPVSGAKCQLNYITLPGTQLLEASPENNTSLEHRVASVGSVDRFCGFGLAASLLTQDKPFVIRVRTGPKFPRRDQTASSASWYANQPLWGAKFTFKQHLC